MANRYEFKIEEINQVMMTTLTDPNKYTVIYTRKIDPDGTPSREFVQTYSAQPEKESEEFVNVICPRCERWNMFAKEYYESEEFEYSCDYCAEEHEDICAEDDLIEIIYDILDESFFDMELIINGTHIK